MAISISIIFEPFWDRLAQYLHVVPYDRDGGHDDPRIRIDFLDLPESWAYELVMFEMPCVACRSPNHPLRHRQGDDWTRLFYAPTCSQTRRLSCSRTRAAELEYERFKGIVPPPSPQLSLI